MIVHKLGTKSEPGEPFYLMLMSDLHLGSAFVYEKAILRDLELARTHNARISINGDVFDLVIPSDKKRFKADALAPRFQGRPDVLNAVLDYAVELLAPYVDLIDMIGVGNHETAVEKYGGIDLVSQLVTLLNHQHGGNIQYGGYCGWLLYYPPKPTSHYIGTVAIQYHHGAGGASPVTKGMGMFSRASSYIEGANIIWRGHQHHRTVDTDVVEVCNVVNGTIAHRRRYRVMTGSYLLTYVEQTSADALKNGRKASYAADWGCAPQDKGGILLRAEATKHGAEIRAINV